MGYPITTIDQYKGGVYALPLNDQYTKTFMAFVAEYEPIYLQDLLGCELSKLLIADLTASNIPQADRFKSIWNPFCIDEDCDTLLRSEGIVEMLNGFIYWEYGKTLTNILGKSGSKRNNDENSNDVPDSGTELLPNYYRSIEAYQAIQDFICLNESDYPEFNGQMKEYAPMI